MRERKRGITFEGTGARYREECAARVLILVILVIINLKVKLIEWKRSLNRTMMK